MKTTRPLRSRFLSYLCAVSVMGLSGGFSGVSHGASEPAPRTKDKRSKQVSETPPPPSDPYVAFLNDVASTSEPCKKHAQNLPALLKQREELLTRSAGANAKQNQKLATQIDELDGKIAAEELGLDQCYAKHVPTEVPPPEPTVPLAKDGTVIELEKLKEPYYPPVPVPPSITVPPAPAGESAYVDFLTANAGDSPLIVGLAESLHKLLEDRREAAVRYLLADEGDQPFLATLILALSQRIRDTADGIQSGAQLAAQRQTAAM